MTAVTAVPRGARGVLSTIGWTAGTSLLGIAVMVSSVAGPTVPVAIVLVLLMAAVAIFRPKAFVVLGLSVIVLNVLLERVGGSAAGNSDEAVVLLSVVAFTVRRLVTEGRIVWMPGTLPLLGFVVVGAVSSVQQHVPPTIAIAAVLLYLKAALYGFAVAQLRWSDRDLRLLLKAGAIAAVITMVVALINLTLPGPWEALTTGRVPLHFGPLPELNGMFQHPAAMSRWCSLLAVAALGYLIAIRSSAFPIVVATVSSVIAILTLEVKSLLGLIAAFLVVGIRSMKPLGLVAVLCIGPIAIAVAGPAVVSVVAGTLNTYLFQESARLRLTTGAVHLAIAHFPLGAGFGRWGSSPAATSYSPLYVQAGFENVYGLSPRSPDFLNDTQWPAILGESGAIGAAFFLLAIVVAAVSLLRPASAAETPLQHWIRLAGLGWVFVLLIESSAAPVFVSTPSYPFLFLGIGIVASLRDARPRYLDPLPVAKPLRAARPARALTGART